MVKALMLFGSAARGDNNDLSDTDLLAVTEGGVPYSLKNGTVEVQHIPVKSLTSMAISGDLFAIHLALEGKVIFDNDLVFRDFRENLRIRKSYTNEREKAGELGWFLQKFGKDYSNHLLVNRRIAWCVRTILISLLVEDGRFVFSPLGLARSFPEIEVETLISLRRSDARKPRKYVELERFLRKTQIEPPEKTKKLDYKRRFDETGNSIAISTLKSLKLPKKPDVEISEYLK